MILRPLLLACSALTLAATLAPATQAAETPVALRILGTTDIHSALMNYDYYRDQPDESQGLSKVATLVRQARGEVANSLLLDDGDLIQGNPLGDYIAKVRGVGPDKIHPVYKAMNLMGYDAGSLGNHEFNYGLAYLADVLKGAKFPVVNANVELADGSRTLLPPYVILERRLKDSAGSEHPVKIGVVAVAPPQVMQWDKINLEGKVVARDIAESVARYVPEMRAKGADLVIVTAHSGIGPTDSAPGSMQENATYAISKVPGVDAILFGHSHLIFPSPQFANVPGADLAKGTLNGIPAAMPGFWGSHLAVIDLALTVDDAGKWKSTGGTGAARPISKLEDRKRIALVDNDPAVVAALAEDHEATLKYIRAPFGRTEAPIFSYFSLVQDDPSIQIVTDAQTWYAKRILKGTPQDGLPILSAGAPFKAGGRSGSEFYTDIPAGELAVKNAADLYLYPNTLQAVLITGAQVREWLEMSAGIFNQVDPDKTGPQSLINPAFPSFNYDVIDGVTYQIDVSQPRRYDMEGKVMNADAHRITGLQYQGKPIDEAQKFVVVTNNYRASGGGKFPGIDGSNIILQAPDENRTVLMNYISEMKSVNPSADGNWRFKPLGKPVVAEFDSSPAAAKLLGSNPALVSLGAGENGFARYGVKLD